MRCHLMTCFIREFVPTLSLSFLSLPSSLVLVMSNNDERFLVEFALFCEFIASILESLEWEVPEDWWNKPGRGPLRDRVDGGGTSFFPFLVLLLEMVERSY